MSRTTVVTVDMHFATIWETVADTVPDAAAVVQGERRLTWGEYDERSARLAAALAELDVRPDSKVGLYLFNGPEYLIAQNATFKVRGVAVNVNYRYLDDELRYLLDNSDTEVLFFHTSLGDRVARIRDGLPRLKALVAVDDGGPGVDGALSFDDLMSAHEPHPRVERPGSDIYMLYTGGTTGMPKGVMYRQDAFCLRLYQTAAGFLGLPSAGSMADVPDLVRQLAAGGGLTSIPACPLMHGTGMWVGTMIPHHVGGAAVLLESRSFDPHELWRAVEREAVAMAVIVGDAFARPMLRALEEAEAEGRSYDLSSLRMIVSSGAMWSAEVKDGLTARTGAVLVDALGSTEGGGYGARATAPGEEGSTAKFALNPGARIVDEVGKDVEPGSGRTGMLLSPTPAIGYFKDPEKTAATFVELDGEHYVRTGDWAGLEADGTVTLLGRGSQCINTGGEKVYPEEVEEAVKRHPVVEDCLVVGLPDPRFGQQVVAVAAVGPAQPPAEEELREWLHGQLSGYKVPKRVVFTDRVQRAPNGKADYGWAKEAAIAVVGDAAPTG